MIFSQFEFIFLNFVIFSQFEFNFPKLNNWHKILQGQCTCSQNGHFYDNLLSCILLSLKEQYQNAGQAVQYFRNGRGERLCANTIITISMSTVSVSHSCKSASMAESRLWLCPTELSWLFLASLSLINSYFSLKYRYTSTIM